MAALTSNMALRPAPGPRHVLLRRARGRQPAPRLVVRGSLRFNDSRAAPSRAPASSSEPVLGHNTLFGGRPQTTGDETRNYDHAEWNEHRSPWRFFRHFVTLFLDSRTSRNIAGPVAGATVFAAAAVAAYEHAKVQLAAGAINSLWVLPMLPLNITASTLGLLLVFRTNASYGRFDESRKLWGLITNRIRDVNRQASIYFPDQPGKAELLGVLQRWSVAFVHSLKCHLREGCNLKAELRSVLPQHELGALMGAEHRPLRALQVMAEAIRASKADSYKQVMMDSNITTFEDCVGACERIFKTPIPTAYTRHTSRFMLVWLTLLPIALAPDLSWMTVPVTAMVAYFIIGVEDIGVAIEEPFKKLTLDAKVVSLAANTAATIHQDMQVAASIVDKAALEGRWEDGSPAEGAAESPQAA